VKVDSAWVIFDVQRSVSRFVGPMIAHQHSDEELLKEGVYIITPMSFITREPKDFVLAFHSSKPILVNKIQVDLQKFVHNLQTAIALDTSEYASRQMLMENSVLIKWDCKGTLIWVVENKHWGLGFSFQLDCTDSVGMICSRDTFLSNDTVPPMHRQLVMVLSQEDSSKTTSFSAQFKFGFIENNGYHDPPLEHIDLHVPLSILS